jgi:hypothetical protein
MSEVLKFLNAAADKNEHRRNLRSHMTKIFAQASVTVPAYSQQFALSKIDEAIKDMSLDDRLVIKSALRQADMIDVGA